MIEVENVATGSEGETLGILVGDRISKINGEKVRDVLDFHFRSSGEDLLDIELFRGTSKLSMQIAPDGPSDLGIRIAPMKTRLCGNDCVFCFVHQNPTGMRDTIYVQDEDYRLSFLHGNFVTLSNMKDWEIERIVEQRLSPIYISIHSTNPVTRQRMIRARKDRDIQPTLQYFVENDIQMHTQVVLVPGYNDGEDLRQTVRDLAALHPHVESLAVVPLGMTDHREGLTKLDKVSPELAAQTIADAETFQREFRERWGVNWLYLADEWYRILDRPVPDADHYDGFPQLENGIGMTRHFLEELRNAEELFPRKRLGAIEKVTLVTGHLFEPMLGQLVTDKLETTGENLQVQTVGVQNDFFGHGVTVAGLLGGRDILAALQKQPDLGDAVILPSPVLNDDDLFLDDTPFSTLEETLGVPVHVGFRDRLW